MKTNYRYIKPEIKEIIIETEIIAGSPETVVTPGGDDTNSETPGEGIGESKFGSLEW